MNRQDFHIQQLAFDIDFFSKEKAYDLQNRVSRLFAQQWQGQMQAIFEKTAPPDALLKADFLVLDLGNVSYENFENDINAKFESVLADFFSKLLTGNAAVSHQNNIKRLCVVPLRTGYLQLLESFLLTGVLQVAATGGLVQLEKNTEELFSHESSHLYQLIRSAGQMEAVRKRLAYQFSESFIRKVIVLLEPGEAPFIFQYKENLETAQRQSPVVTIDTSHFQKDIRVFILTFLLIEKGSQFNRKEFIKSTLKQMAARYNIGYEELLQYFGQNLSMVNNQMNKTELLQLIASLTDEANAQQEIHLSTGEEQNHIKVLQETEISEPDIAKDITALEKELQWLYHYFFYGSFPKEADDISRSERADRILSFLRSQPKETHIVLSRFSGETLAQRGFRLGGELLATALTAQRSTISPIPSVHTFSPEEAQSSSVSTLQQKEDILYYFLRNGFLPWWASGQTVSIHALLEEVCLASPKKAKQILQWAGDDNICRERFLNQFSALAPQLLSLLPEGEKAMYLFTLLLSALPDEDRKQAASRRFAEALWDNYDFHGHQSFNEVLFIAVAGREVSRLYRIPPGDIEKSLLRFVEKREAAVWQDAVRRSLEKGKPKDNIDRKEHPSSGANISEEEFIVVLLSYANENRNQASETAAETGDVNLLQKALLQSLSHFFTHNRFPKAIEDRTSAPSLLLCKKALLLLHSLSATETEHLLVSYAIKEERPSLLTDLFWSNDYREKEMMLLLHKINLREASPLQNRPPATEANLTFYSTLLLQQHYLPGEVSFEKKKEKARSVLSYFLTWHKLPQSRDITFQTPAEELLKELVLFLFAADRTALQTILQNKTNMPEAVLSLSGVIKSEKGGEEALAARFIKPYVQDAVLDCLWENQAPKEKEEDKENRLPANVLPDVFSLLSGSSGEAGSAEEQAAKQLDYFLLHNALPPSLSGYPAREAIVNITRFLLRKKKSLLKQVAEKETHLPAARLKWYDWLQQEKEWEREELQPLLRKAVEKDVADYLQQAASDKLPREVRNSLPALWQCQSAEEKKVFLQVIASYTAVREEWLTTIPANELYSVLKNTHSQRAKQYMYLLNLLGKLASVVLQPGYEQEQFQLHSHVFLLLIIAGHYTVNDLASFVSGFFTYLDQRRPSFVPQLYQNIQQQWEKVEPLLAADALLKKEIHRAVALRQPAEPALRIIEEKRNHSLRLSALQKQREEVEKRYVTEGRAGSLSSAPEEKTNRLKLNIETGTRLYINNAGLVLLHPFIPTLFMLTGLTERNDFINEDAQKRAVLLLQYAATNITEHEEPSLVLNKLLCGLPPEEPVPSSIALTVKEIQVTAELFTIIFQRWPRMKNASADGFRQSFLQRKGRLLKGEKAWAMRVEQRGYDVLLQTIPWAFGVVKLPWMPEPIEIEWM